MPIEAKLFSINLSAYDQTLVDLEFMKENDSASLNKPCWYFLTNSYSTKLNIPAWKYDKHRLLN